MTEWYGRKRKELKIATGEALWYRVGEIPVHLRWVIIKDPESGKPPAVLLSTDPELKAKNIVAYFVQRWSIEVTFEEVRAHLGVESQRQWSDKAIARITPSLFALFSLITLIANHLNKKKKLSVRTAAWYKKELPTFSDAIASCRGVLRNKFKLNNSENQKDMVLIPHKLWEEMLEQLNYAA